jgi:hypothetical protein
MPRVGSVVPGVSDVPRAGAFWMEALGYVPRKDMEDDWVVLVPAEGAGVQLALHDRARTSFAWLTTARPAWSRSNRVRRTLGWRRARNPPTPPPRRSPGCTAAPASILIRTERRLSGAGCRPAPRVTPGGRPGAGGARKKRKLVFYDVGHSAPPTNRRA